MDQGMPVPPEAPQEPTLSEIVKDFFTSSHQRLIYTVGITLVVLLAIPISVITLQHQQDIRSRAAEPLDCTFCPNQYLCAYSNGPNQCKPKTDASASFCSQCGNATVASPTLRANGALCTSVSQCQSNSCVVDSASTATTKPKYCCAAGQKYCSTATGTTKCISSNSACTLQTSTSASTASPTSASSSTSWSGQACTWVGALCSGSTNYCTADTYGGGSHCCSWGQKFCPRTSACQSSACPTPTPSPTPTKTPIPPTTTTQPGITTTVLTSTPTATPFVPTVTVFAPTVTVGPTATLAIGETRLAFVAALPGIGNVTGKNNTPASASRAISVDLLKLDLTPYLSNISGTIAYDPSAGQFNGYAILPSTFVSGNYFVRVRTDQTLKKFVPGGAPFVTAGNNNQFGLLTLDAGDANKDNYIDLLDYNIFNDCLSGTGTCTLKTDLNSDGVTSILDLNILLRNYYSDKRQGD